MPLPHILTGAAIITASYGAKKACDARKDFAESMAASRNARDIYDQAKARLQYSRKMTSLSLQSLTEKKQQILTEQQTTLEQIRERVNRQCLNHKDTEHLQGINFSLTAEDIRKVEKLPAPELYTPSVLKNSSLLDSAGTLATLGAAAFFLLQPEAREKLAYVVRLSSSIATLMKVRIVDEDGLVSAKSTAALKRAERLI